MSPRRAISSSNFEESVIHVSAVRRLRGEGGGGSGMRGEKVEARTRRTRRRRGAAGRRRKRSDGQRTVVEQRRCYFRMNIVEGRLSLSQR